MNETAFRRLIEDLVRENLSENKMRNHVRSIVSEELHKAYLRKKRINESDGEEDNSKAIKRKAVMNMLKDQKYNHASLAYSIWHPKDQKEKDTFRSLFSKMATGTPDADGAVRSFSDDDISKLYELMRKN